MSRHNRRRTRGGHKAKHQRSHTETSYDARLTLAEYPLLEAQIPFHASVGWGDQSYTANYRPSPASSSSYCMNNTFDPGDSRLGGISANPATVCHWTSRYLAWQAREAEKQRMYGVADGSGEDEVLCMKMKEYFDKLDFIDF